VVDPSSETHDYSENEDIGRIVSNLSKGRNRVALFTMGKI